MAEFDQEKFCDELVARLRECCVAKGWLPGGALPASEDIDERMKPILKEYLGDAVREFNAYPEVTLAWAGYIGMAVAKWWDKSWKTSKEKGYENLKGPRGFDDLDEHVTEKILGYKLGGKISTEIANQLAYLAAEANNVILHSGLEELSTDAFRAFVASLMAMYRIGEALELKRLGYKMTLLS